VYRIRPAEQADAVFLADMLVEAFNWHPDRMRRRVELLADPSVNRYLAGWRRPGDDGVLAVDDHGDPVGACWFRVLPKRDAGYGWVAAGVPELTLGVRPIHRARGVGRTLLRAACAVATGHGHQRISLSVERANFASRLYVSEGFATLTSGPDADTMVKTLR
jgi:GNAT superfamily N-acetyltransferase